MNSISDILTSSDHYARVGRMAPREIMKQYGKSYFLALQFINPSKKDAIATLYKFVRIFDLVVDEHRERFSDESKKQIMTDLIFYREKVLASKCYDDVFFGDVARIVHEYHLDYDAFSAFLDAMMMDIHKKTYETFSDLCQYMYGSAEVIGLLLTQIIGYTDPQALDYAKKLGRAMQYANFLRDVQEDWRDLHRIYLPRHDLHQYGLSFDDIIHFCETKTIDERRISYMKYAIAQCDALYEESIAGIKYLRKFSRQGIYLSARLYQGILRKIERIDYNVFANSARTTTTEKMMIVARYILDRSRKKR